jgi:hypothetical protein
MTTISKQYLESGTYEIALERSEETDLYSYVYTRFGTFSIRPLDAPLAFVSLAGYEIYLDNGLIGKVTIDPSLGIFESLVANAMASALDIVTNKIHELIDKEERAVMATLVTEVIDSINITEEQKAMYRTFLIETGKLDDVITEMENPTDILGDQNV